MASEWKQIKIIECIDLIGGGTPKTSVAEYWDGDIPWLSVKDFNNDNRYVYSTEKTITEEGLNNSSTKLLQKDDIIISYSLQVTQHSQKNRIEFSNTYFNPINFTRRLFMLI